ncbi:hypothetical protein EVAR_37530_1 [Eumeta japonica]|uniref:Uncharacterized protein n=1 Tax=Eumeta variegata TaxID=151549 RepID=A0A4C1XRC2_EUMVA|nr:hypothetical protein EVAR_37530_1 [Eumeta japonica]
MSAVTVAADRTALRRSVHGGHSKTFFFSGYRLYKRYDLPITTSTFEFCDLYRSPLFSFHHQTPSPSPYSSFYQIGYFYTRGPRLSDAKIKEGVFDGPQIRSLMADEKFDATMNNTELDAWLAFKDVVNNF